MMNEEMKTISIKIPEDNINFATCFPADYTFEEARDYIFNQFVSVMLKTGQARQKIDYVVN